MTKVMQMQNNTLQRAIKGANARSLSGIIIGILSIPLNYYLLAIKYRDEISSALGKTYAPSI